MKNGCFYRKVLSAALFAVTAFTGFTQDEINLNSFPLYVRRGFSAGYITGRPESGAPQWQRIAPSPEGRTAPLFELPLPEMPERPFLSFRSFKVQEFTYLIPFHIDSTFLSSFRPGSSAAGAGSASVGTVSAGTGSAGSDRAAEVPGFHFASLGDNWQIYLNGVLVREEMHLNEEGEITDHRGHRDVFFPFPPDLLKLGENILAVRMVGDPTFPPTGFYQAEPYILAPYNRIVRMNAELWPMVLIGLYMFIGIYHIFIFFARRKDRYNLFYGLFSIDLSVYLYSRTHSIYRIIVENQTIFRIELFSLFILIPLLGAFLDTLLDNRIRKITYGYGLLCALLALGMLAVPVNVAHDLLRLWQATGLAMALYYFGYVMLWRFLYDGFRRWLRYRGSPRGRTLVGVYWHALGTTALGNLLIGAFILFATGIFDILDAIFFHLDIVLTQYGFFVFTMGTALVLANRLGFLHRQLSGLNANLENRIVNLTETSDRLKTNEMKYRSLFEGTSEPVALLDEEYRFRESNKAASDLFGLSRRDRENAKFTALFYGEDNERRIDHRRFLQAAERMKTGKEAVEIPVRITTALGEPKSCRVRLEHITSLQKSEILLRVLPEERDPLSAFFRQGKERYEIENTLTAADEVCRRVTRGLHAYLNEEEVNVLMICLREMVVNAIEHGSLELSFEEKSAAQREQRYFEFLQERQNQSPYNQRRVTVEYSISAEKAVFRVTDQGPGFDHRSTLPKDGEPPAELLEHGRGIFMTMNSFDKLQYNEKGNSVTLVRYLKS